MRLHIVVNHDKIGTVVDVFEPAENFPRVLNGHLDRGCQLVRLGRDDRGRYAYFRQPAPSMDITVRFAGDGDVMTDPEREMMRAVVATATRVQ